MNKITEWKMVLAAAVGALTGLWGWMGWLVLMWIGCMALDYLTGTAAASKAGEWSSRRAREGIWHKAGMIVVVVVSAVADLLLSIVIGNLPLLSLPWDYTGLICPIVLVWYVITELGSVAENAMLLGAPVPKWLVRLLEAGKAAVDKAGDALTGSKEDEA